MIKKLLFILFIAFLLIRCDFKRKSEYQVQVEKELAKGVRNDSLFLGYYFGMTRKEFYDHSWDLNKKQKVVNGNGAEIQQNVIGLNSMATKIFYPEFKNEKIYQMPVKYSYNGWAPWNRHLWADSLKYDIKNYLENTYDYKFHVTSNPRTGEEFFYYISGNKEIRIVELDQSRVLVKYTDLTQIK